MTGYIKLYRSLQDCKVLKDEKFSRRDAFIDMIFRCNHKCSKICLGYNLVLVKRGQFVSSNLKLAEAWNWSERTVRRFIILLQSEKMVTFHATNKYTLYEVTKYAEYQSIETEQLELYTCRANAEQTPNKRRANAEQTPTNNNVNNEKNEKNEKNTTTPTPLFSSPWGGGGGVEIPKEKIPEDKISPENFYCQNIGMPSPFIIQEMGYIREQIDSDLITRYMQYACTQNAGNKWAYTKKLVENGLSKNIKTVTQFEASIVEWENHKKKQNAGTAVVGGKTLQRENFDQRTYEEDDWNKYYYKPEEA